jgi:hypothetical protein
LWPGILLMSRPLKTTRPDDSGRRPEIVLSVVDLPAPLAPISVTISPSSTSKETPLRAAILP